MNHMEFHTAAFPVLDLSTVDVEILVGSESDQIFTLKHFANLNYTVTLYLDLKRIEKHLLRLPAEGSWLATSICAPNPRTWNPFLARQVCSKMPESPQLI